ncbi:MAG: DUF1579 family protein [Acidobacteriota bacterium]|nr:DUF1579 family protein [Acidobacteriota bacterium]
MRLALFLALGLAVAAVPLSAQDKADDKKAPPTMASMMNKPGPEAAKLKGMVGTWNVEETMEASPMGPAGKGRAISRVTLGPGGLSIIIDYRSIGGHMKGYRGHGVVAWDGEAKAYKQVWADNMAPMLMVSTGKWEGDKLVMDSEGTMMGKPFKAHDTLSGIGTDAFTLVSEMSMDGGPMAKMMTLAHKRAKAPEEKPAEKKEEVKK